MTESTELKAAASTGMSDSMALLAAMTPKDFVAYVRSTGIDATCEEVGSKRGAGVSRTRQVGNLCEHVFGKARRNEYLAAFFGG